MKYQTAQRERLLAFFKESPDRQYTIDSLEEAIDGISKATVCRNINQMVDDGIVRRFQKEGSRKFLYQYMGTSECSKHFHLTCSECGAVYHMDNKTSRKLSNTLGSIAGFSLDTNKTMLVGCCSACK